MAAGVPSSRAQIRCDFYGMVHGAGGAVADLAPELEGFCPEIDKFGALARAARSAWFIILEGLMVSPALARKSPQRLLLENASERTTKKH